MIQDKNKDAKNMGKDAGGRDTNPDLITNAPGSHPVATGVGAAAAGATGAIIGSVVPGIGTAIGGAVGAIVGAVGGGYAGKAVGEAIDPTETDAYWKDNYKTREYAKTAPDYARLRPAYHYGASLADRSDEATFDEDGVRSEWQQQPQAKGLDFNDAKGAIRDEFQRKIQLREEQLRVEKERVSAGEVGIRKEVTTERKTIEVPVEREEVVITRRGAIGQANAGGTIEDEEIRVPLSEERVKVSKDTMVTGEVEIGKRKVVDTKTVSEDLRKEDVRVDKGGASHVEERTN